MKSIKKFLFVVAALAATLAFVSCSSGDDDPSTVAVYKADDDGEVSTITFLDDNTWTWKAEVGGESKEVYAGTYTGDPSKDGKIAIKVTKAGGKDLPTAIEDEVIVTDKKVTLMTLTFTRQ